MSSISMKVAEKLGNSGEQISARVVDVLVEREVARLTEATIKAIGSLDTLTKDLAKLKPDVEMYDDDGVVISKSWSKKQNDERKNLTARIAKIQAAVDKALDKNDFADLLKLANGGSKNEQSATDQE